MNEFFDMLDSNVFARIFIVIEVWISVMVGYALGYINNKKKK
jgi:hypothetical protein